MAPMFEIAEGDLPFVRTRQALLLLDLQNDFLTKGCLLPVENPPDFLENAINLASTFRNSGDVIWFRSHFLTSRAINDKTNPDSESVITDNELPSRSRPAAAEETARIRPRLPAKLREPKPRLAAKVAESIADLIKDGEDEKDVEDDISEVEDGDPELQEAFLTARSGQRSRVALPESAGANLCLASLRALDNSKDLIFQKSHYSAFKDGNLIQTLRGKFVTEIFICGALTNISIFATAMDAARHGLAITLVEDCLGYRSKARHDEALRQLTEYTGCDVITSTDLIKALQQSERARAKERTSTPKSHTQPGQNRNDHTALEQMMRKLQLEGSSKKPESESAPPRSLSPQSSRPSAPITPILAAEPQVVTRDSFDDEEFILPPKTEPQKRERVRSKIKSRRRPSNPLKPTSKENAVNEQRPGVSRTDNPSTATTLQGTSGLLEKMSKDSKASETTAATAFSSAVTEVPAAKVKDQEGPMAESDDSAAVVQVSASETGPPICEGDTYIINNVLSGELAQGIFEKVRDEVRWQRMSHQGGEVPRLVSVQGEIAKDGSMPIYRHPADESPPLSPFSPTVSHIRKQVEVKLGHSVNHVLIQFYRGGTDYISEHSDKTLDIVHGTFIANISLGAQRTMVFRTKKPLKSDEKDEEPAPRKSCRAPLPHNSMCKMGLKTNMCWLHGIRQDKRMTSEKSKEELAYEGGRISLTFRKIGTFLDKDQIKIWGQGAVAKSKDSANTVINGPSHEAEGMIKAFGKENHSSDFDWKSSYGPGFDVLHISNSRKLFLSGDFIADTRVKFMLSELGIDWTEASLSPAFLWEDGDSHRDASEQLPVKFVDDDLSRSTVQGDLAILLYLNTIYGAKTTDSVFTSHARILNRFCAVVPLLEKWRSRQITVNSFRQELLIWNSWATESEFIAGERISIADFAVWPLLDEIFRDWGSCQKLSTISAYHKKLRESPSLQKVLGPWTTLDAPRSDEAHEINK